MCKKSYEHLLSKIKWGRERESVTEREEKLFHGSDCAPLLGVWLRLRGPHSSSWCFGDK